MLGREISSLSVVVAGAGAAGVAVTQLLQLAGVTDVVVCDSRGIIGKHRNDLVAHKEMLAATTNVTGKTGTMGDALKDADVYIGVSGGNVPEEQVAAIAEGPMIFALANPTPEAAVTTRTRSTTCRPSPASSAAGSCMLVGCRSARR